jgi:uncharacterized membrane protein YraQ (UPF0718 family)
MFPLFNNTAPYTDFHEMNLDWVLKHIKELIDDVDGLKAWRKTHEAEYQELVRLYEEVKTDWDNFAAGNFPPSTYEAMRQWFESNAVDLVGELVRFVFFGLTLDGHFVAYIPENWHNIEFDTIVTPGENYGKLTISY